MESILIWFFPYFFTWDELYESMCWWYEPFWFVQIQTNGVSYFYYVIIIIKKCNGFLFGINKMIQKICNRICFITVGLNTKWLIDTLLMILQNILFNIHCVFIDWFEFISDKASFRGFINIKKKTLMRNNTSSCHYWF